MGLIGCTATSVTKYHPTLHNIPEENLRKTVVSQQMYMKM
jgi:hypothetical protein